jgi:drug/metabolite transporter superfamily protein YnfA
VQLLTAVFTCVQGRVFGAVAGMEVTCVIFWLAFVQNLALLTRAVKSSKESQYSPRGFAC